jgi:hypothetical protein
MSSSFICDPALCDPAICDTIRRLSTLNDVLTQLENKTPRMSMWEPGYWEPGSMNEFSPARTVLENIEK